MIGNNLFSDLSSRNQVYREHLAVVDIYGRLALHRLLKKKSSSAEDALMMIETYPAAVSHRDKYGDLPLHIECQNQCRSAIIAKCIELHPEGFILCDRFGVHPLQTLCLNKSSSTVVKQIIHEKIEELLLSAADDPNGSLIYRIRLLCRTESRIPILTKCIELYPQQLAVADENNNLPLHLLLLNSCSSMEDALMMIDAYPAALEHRNESKDLPLHIECKSQCRLSIIAKCIELYPDGLLVFGKLKNHPLECLLSNKSMSVDVALLVIEKLFLAMSRHPNGPRIHPIHLICRNVSGIPVLAKCIELYPNQLAVADQSNHLPLHALLHTYFWHENELSLEKVALMMIEAYPAALKHENINGKLPLHIECMYRCRSNIIAKCIELYPESLDEEAIDIILSKVHSDDAIRLHASALSLIFTIQPMSLYNFHAYDRWDKRANPRYRRKILNLLPRHVFSQMHEADYADLNWKPRSAMLQLLSQIHQQSRQSNMNAEWFIGEELQRRSKLG